jgi:hypothetical protein
MARVTLHKPEDDDPKDEDAREEPKEGNDDERSGAAGEPTVQTDDGYTKPYFPLLLFALIMFLWVMQLRPAPKS